MRVGQAQLRDETFVSGHQTIRHGQVHQLPRALKLFGFQIWASLENRTYPLSVNFLGPARTKKIRQRKTQQQIPQGRRMQYASIIDGNEARHALVSQSQFLGLPGEFVESFLALHA